MTGVGLLRTRERTARVTNVELFFDLVYVFAVTQLSHYLLDHRSVAAADVVVLSKPGAVGVVSTGWLVLGGTALFLAGHAAFKFAVWRVVPWTRLAALVVLGLLGLAVPALPALGLGLCAAVVVLAVAALDYRVYRGK